MNWFNKTLTLTVIAVMTILPISTQAAMICETDSTADDFVVGFFNGVGNTEAQAQLSQAYIMKFHGASYEDKTIAYETFYNHTGSAVGSNTGQDLTEVFRQRADELDASGYLSERFELFYAMTNQDSGNLLQDLLQTIGDTNENLRGLIEDLYTDISNEVLAQVGELFYQPPTFSDYAVHSSRIANLATQGSALIFIAHSQGNLFANAAYDYTLSLENISESNVGVVHVAPAVTRTVGEHVLADKDIVINGLRATGTVPENTIEIPISHLAIDYTGHGFVETYMVESIGTKGQVSEAYNKLLSSLTQPEQLTTVGAFTATLTWNGLGDADLHIFEPEGDQVFYANEAGSAGYLDYDNRQGYGPEHYYASCDNIASLPGTFDFAVNNYSRADGLTATIQISTPNIANVITKSVTLGRTLGSSGNDDPQRVLSVTVTETESGLELIAN